MKDKNLRGWRVNGGGGTTRAARAVGREVIDGVKDGEERREVPLPWGAAR